MATYRIIDPQTGKTLKITGDSPPTEQELEDIFSQIGGQKQPSYPLNQQAIQPTQQQTESAKPMVGLPGMVKTDERIAGRQGLDVLNPMEGLKQLLAIKAQDISQGKGINQLDTFNIAASEASKRMEASVANPAIAMQKGEFSPSVVMDEVSKGLLGEKISEYGDVYRNLGAPEWIAAPLGMLNLSATYAVGKILSKIKPPKLPKLKPNTYNDKVVSGLGENIYKKANLKLNEYKAMYDTAYKPVENTSISSEGFAKVYNNAPKRLQARIINDYSVGILDHRGRPMSSVTKMRNLMSSLDDMIKNPDVLGKVKPKEILRLKMEAKNVMMDSIPPEVATKIKSIDVKWGPTIESVKSIAKSVKPSPNGPVKTNYLFDKFNNPKYAGDRNFMRELKNLDIDLTPEIKGIEKWVGRQKLKHNILSTGEASAKMGILYKLIKR